VAEEFGVSLLVQRHEDGRRRGLPVASANMRRPPGGNLLERRSSRRGDTHIAEIDRRHFDGDGTPARLDDGVDFREQSKAE
jgi:hypothetical protein